VLKAIWSRNFELLSKLTTIHAPGGWRCRSCWLLADRLDTQTAIYAGGCIRMCVSSWLVLAASGH